MSWERYDPKVDMIVRRPSCNVVEGCDLSATWVRPRPGSDDYACALHGPWAEKSSGSAGAAKPCTPGDAEWQRRFDLFLADPRPVVWWWLVFQDPKFMGLAILPGANHVQAMSAAWALGCNPGGAVASYRLEVVPKPEYWGRLFTDPEAQALADGTVEWWVDP